jgi:hypothetical protein
MLIIGNPLDAPRGLMVGVVSVTSSDTFVIASSTAPNASANGRFDIVVRYTGDPAYQAAFTQAAIRWSQIIIGDIPDFNSGQYGFIDDLLIDARIVPIDGPGRILGQAGPDLFRSGSMLPAHGVMEFDSADVASMYASGIWTDVILHEMGHVLGVGTLWDALGLKNGAGNYIGARGLAEYRLVSGNAGATSVPVEQGGGPGTAGAHWSEAVFNAELMTGFVESFGGNPISRVTVGALQDLGYTVNYAAADVYTLPGGPVIIPITGDNNDNSLNGTGAGEIIYGLGGNDTLNGLGGNDTLDGGLGNDRVDGGAGDDTAVFSGNLVSYTLRDLGTRILVSGPDGNDTLVSVEHLRFADGVIHAADGNPHFDTVFYMRGNLDVFRAGVDALAHYNAWGWREGRDPNPYLDASWYLAINPDVRASGVNPLNHYLNEGWRQGRDPAPNFDTQYYLFKNPDVARAGMNPLSHFLQFGQAEGRVAYDAIGSAPGGFDAQYYLAHNPDIAAAGVDPLSHFNAYGWREGRDPNAYFDITGYLSHYADVRAVGMNPLQHYMAYGWLEGRDPSTLFDSAGYLAVNPDVAAARINPLAHYLNYGIYEGRALGNDGVWG